MKKIYVQNFKSMKFAEKKISEDDSVYILESETWRTPLVISIAISMFSLGISISVIITKLMQ
ncbi:hypothetical protein [Aliarcobacter butzleri]|uniref:hypothetical protein n=1 Tax=Aliarcobacter butzleri TaxID=28197 RepID=UPI0021B458B1|nr:hypothetical protein [Aliarcobacter butzleri]MCT7647629.1 hypothetical protein [Aliarcobacter butzleri]